MMDCHIHYAIVTVRFCTDIFSRFFALRNTRAGHDGQYWDDSIRKRLLRRRKKTLEGDFVGHSYGSINSHSNNKIDSR